MQQCVYYSVRLHHRWDVCRLCWGEGALTIPAALQLTFLKASTDDITTNIVQRPQRTTVDSKNLREVRVEHMAEFDHMTNKRCYIPNRSSISAID